MPNEHVEHDLFLLMLNLSQLDDEGAVRSIFLDAMEQLWPGAKLTYLPEGSEASDTDYRIATLRNDFGHLRLVQPSPSLGAEVLPLFRNALAMLAIILENLRQARLLSGERVRLESLVKERTREYADANERLAHEIEERKRTEHTLGVALAKYRILFETFPLGVTIADKSGNIVESNTMAERLLGLSREEQSQRQIAGPQWHIIRPDGSAMPPEEYASVRALAEHRAVGNVEMGLVDPGRETVWLSVTAAPLDLEGYGTVIAYGDITEHKRAQAALEESQEYLRSFYEAVPAGILVQKASGEIAFTNRVGAEILGMPAEEIQGKTSLDAAWHMCDEDGQPVPGEEHPSMITLRTGRSIRNTVRGLRVGARQELRWLLINTEPLCAGRGREIDKVLVSFLDITERRQAELALRESERRYHSLFENMLEGFALCEMVYEDDDPADFVYLDVNGAFGRLTGLVNVVGKRASEVIPGIREAHPELLATYSRVAATGEPESFEIRFTPLDLWLAVSAYSPQKNQFAAVFHDVSLRKRAESDLARQHDLLQARLLLQEFSANHNLDAFMQAVLDEAERLTGSTIGFMHFLEDDQKTLTLQMWSSNTIRSMCTAEGKGTHYAVEQAGVWADCVRERRPVVHNDYQNLAYRRGLPAGHAPIVRELVVPLLSGDKINVIMGVGNKATEYDEHDVETLSRFTMDLWETVLRKRAEEALRRTEERYRALVEANFDWVWETDAQGRYTYVSPRVRELLGYEPEEVMGRTPFSLMPEGEAARLRGVFDAYAASRQPFVALQNVNRHKDGRLVTLETSAVPIIGVDGRLIGYRGVDRDLTERRQLEEQLRHSQKMEAVGQLAGGVAHDFNNLLQVIMASIDMANEDLEPGHPAHESIMEVAKAAERAKGLVTQLLAFSRRQIMCPDAVDLNTLINEFMKMIKRVIGEHITLRFVSSPQVGTVLGDPGMLEQVLMNLCVNARDAMGSEGILTLETTVFEADEAFCQLNPWAKPGQYAMLAVSDTGSGIDPEAVPHVFEPFYTTKDKGRGTGLGLATVYGIVRQHDGMINIQSELGVGTTFTIYLPTVEAPAHVKTTRTGDTGVVGGDETILIAEDDESVRNLVVRVLRKAGYTVIVATNGIEAVQLLRENVEQIDLVMLDVVMPELGGRDAYEQIHAIRPGLPALFASGYSEDAIHTDFVLDAGMNLIQKPYRSRDLLQKVRSVLDAETNRSC